MRAQHTFFLALFALTSTLWSCSPPRTPLGRLSTVWQPLPVPRAKTEEKRWEALFVADSQLHAMTGSHLKSLSTLSSLASAVAVRPSELNILSSLVLADTLDKYATDVAPSDASVFYLGDGLNAACGGELARFQEVLDQQLSRAPRAVPWFMAHGNHDSFMAGVFNDFIPFDEVLEAKEFGQLVSDISTYGVAEPRPSKTWALTPRPFHELSWWTAADGLHAYEPMLTAAAWPGICAGSHVTDVPMNKLVWLAWYLGKQQEQGVRFSKLGAAGDGHEIRGGGALGPLTTRIYGVLHPPTRTYLRSSWESFIVQVVRKDDVAIVLLDTSVGDKVGRAGLGALNSVGSIGHLGPEQLLLLNRLLISLRDVDRIILAGHHPFGDIVHEERKALASLMRHFGIKSYFSAHTHAPSARFPPRDAARMFKRFAGVREVNIGSTTDWPMEAVIARLASEDLPVRILKSRVPEDRECRLDYRAEDADLGLRRPQACAHVKAAERLATMSPEEADALRLGKEWVSPSVDPQCSTEAAAKKMDEYMPIIEQRAADKQDGRFRRFYLCLATRASHTLCGPGYDAPCKEGNRNVERP
jgi:hypothetical protein